MKCLQFFVGASLLVAASACNGGGSGAGSGGDSSYVINGTIKGLDSGWIMLVTYPDGEHEKKDSAQVQQGKFMLKGKADDPSLAYLAFKNGDYNNVASFYLENGVFSLTAGKDSLASADVKGGASQEEYVAYKGLMKSFEDRDATMGQAYQAAAGNKIVQDSIYKAAEGLQEERKAATFQYIKGHPNSFIAATEVISMFSYNPDVKQFESVYNGLGAKVKGSGLGKRIGDLLALAKKTDVGQPAPDFTLADVDGKTQSLLAHKGKYVLLDFWASWCGPCRAENPNVVKAYNAYKGKGFEVVGVSLDEDRAAWQQAIAKDGLAWTQLSDLKGWKSDVAGLYGVRGIPMNYLLDKDGKIVGKGLRGEALEKKLAELMP